MKTKFQSLSLITAPTPGEKKRKEKKKKWHQVGLCLAGLRMDYSFNTTS